jgi:hypothetical protein
MANLLGDSEDFDGLLVTLEDAEVMIWHKKDLPW